jgi:Glycosyltransferase WbsX
MTTSPSFVAYVYPGWHRSAYRPNVDEWQLLARFIPYFDGHQAPPRPLDGDCYDDSKAATVLGQIELARSFGIDTFSYFLYYTPNEFILSAPVYAAFSLASKVSPFAIGLTWCFRLPHAAFPIATPPNLRDDAFFSSQAETNHGEDGEKADSSGSSMEVLRLGTLERLVGRETLDCISAYDVVRFARRNRGPSTRG